MAVLKQKPSRFNRFMHTSLCRLWGPRRKYINEVKPDAMRKIQLEHEPDSCAILLVAKRLAHVNLNQDRDPMSCAKWSVNSTETKYSLKKNDRHMVWTMEYVNAMPKLQHASNSIHPYAYMDDMMSKHSRLCRLLG